MLFDLTSFPHEPLWVGVEGLYIKINTAQRRYPAGYVFKIIRLSDVDIQWFVQKKSYIPIIIFYKYNGHDTVKMLIIK